MAAKVKTLLSVVSDSLETAAGYALVAVGIYAAIFVDLTGGGSLWRTLGHIQEVRQDEIVLPNATRVIKVPTQVVVEKVHEDRMLAVFDPAPQTGAVAAAYQAPETAGPRPSAAFTDVPADPKSGKTWKRSLNGELRNFTVYGRGEQMATVSATLSAPASSDSPALSPVAAPGSAARTPTDAAARPGVGSRLSRGALSASDTTRNIR